MSLNASGPRAAAVIRRYRPDDLDDLYRVCLQTADIGNDATSLFRDGKLPGYIYAAPYAIFEPSLTAVAEDEIGVGGYIVGTLDSIAFEDRLEHDWWPELRARYPEPSPDQTAGISQLERSALHDIHHPWRTRPELHASYPSHLHINLVPRLQGCGLGRQLIEALASALRDQGSRGVHLAVGQGNRRAAGFYRHVGFTELPATDVRLFAMDLRRA